MEFRLQRVGHRLQARPRRRTIRVRLAAVFFAVFVASAVVLLVVTVVVWQSRVNAVTAVPAPSGAAQPAPLSHVTQQSLDRRQLLVASVIALALTAVASILVGWLVAGRFLRPVRVITAATRQISATNLHARLNVSGPDDELKELADTFDRLLDRLERSFTFERRFVANAAHELRTPLAAMRTSLEVAMAKPGPLPSHVETLAQRLGRELDHVERLLESFLTLAHSQQGPADDQATVSLAQLAAAALQRRAAAITERRLTAERPPGPDAWVSGSGTLLARLVDNLVDNAVAHNPPGGWLRVTTSAADARATLVVENGGPVLDPDQVRQLAQPFRRLGAERTGSDDGAGLGLAIVASIVEVHGGELVLEPIPDGGLRATVTLPLAADPADEPAAPAPAAGAPAGAQP